MTIPTSRREFMQATAAIGAGLWVGETELEKGTPPATLHGEAVVDDTVLFDGEAVAVRIEPIASMPEDDLVKLVAPTIQNWLDPTKPLQKPKGGSGGTKPTKTAEPKPRTDS